ncbi:MAG: VanZ family protein [Caldimonas sp.]
MARHRSSAVPLAWLYSALIVYASLYPFTGWRLPRVGPFDFLLLGWPRWWTTFDLVSNLLGYMPVGFLLFVAGVRSGRRTASAAWLAIAVGTLLSLTMETLQNDLPQRVASNVDLALNALGAALGVAVGAALNLRGGIDRWQKLRDRWFTPRSAGGLALLVLWPVALLFPTAVPFGLGHVLGRLQPLIVELLQGTVAEGWSSGWAAAAAPSLAVEGAYQGLSAAGEVAIVVLGLLAPCLVAFAIAIPGWRRALFVLGAAAIGAATLTLSAALNFGPNHALAWTRPQVLQALVVGTGAAVLLSLLPRRIAAGLGLIALTALVMLVAQAPADPYFAQSLQGWEQGRFIRFHGAAQWVGWVWPYAALAYLLTRLAARETREPPESREPHGSG